jgi:hypothetical protein
MSKARTPGSDFARLARRASSRSESAEGRFAKYADDPVGFCVDVLGFRPWSEQRRFLEAHVTNDRCSWRSGHHVGKTAAVSAAAHWRCATRPKARVIMLASSFAQLSETLWYAVRQQHANARVPLGGRIALRPATGLRHEDGRQIIGLSPDDEFRLQGLFGDLHFFVDEAALAMTDGIGEVILGALAGGGCLTLTGNPNRARGVFFSTFKSERWTRMHTPSTASPNFTEEWREFTDTFPMKGLANPEWERERAIDWQGPDGPIYKIRVLGEPVEVAEGALFTPDMISAAERAWPTTPATGRIVIGLDPAGSSGRGDESVFCPRRGLKVIRLHARRGLTADAHVAETLGVIREDRGDSHEVPLVVVDRDGTVGADVYSALRIYQQRHERTFELVGFRGGDRATRRPQDVHKKRDEMWLGLVEWFRHGGSIPMDLRLEGELAAIQTDMTFKGLAKIIDKDALRATLGRSPDRGDSLAMSVYVPTIYESDDAGTSSDEDDATPPVREITPHEGAISPFGDDLSPWGNDRQRGGGDDDEGDKEWRPGS